MKNFTQSKTKANYIYKLTPLRVRTKAAFAVQFFEIKRDEYEQLKIEIAKLERELAIEVLRGGRDEKGSTAK